MISIRLPRYPLALLGLLMSIVSHAQNVPATWKIEAPYPNNPLKQALINGDAAHAGLNTKTELQIECRPDADGPRINLVFTPKQLQFDADPFEGPGGLGEHRMLRVALGKYAWSHHFSGYYVESDSFVFSFALFPAEAREITSSAKERQALTITVSPAREAAPLQFDFSLPPNGDPVRKMTAPCLRIPHKS
jgi:hypothetical protein